MTPPNSPEVGPNTLVTLPASRASTPMERLPDSPEQVLCQLKANIQEGIDRAHGESVKLKFLIPEVLSQFLEPLTEGSVRYAPKIGSPLEEMINSFLALPPESSTDDGIREERLYMFARDPNGVMYLEYAALHE